MEIIPAIIPKDFNDLQSKLARVANLVSLVQIDILDGRLTSEPSWPYRFKEDPDFKEIVSQQKGFPYWEKLDFEVDLMAKNPEALWRDWVSAGCKRLIIHLESTDSMEKLLIEIGSQAVAKDSPFYTEIGIAIEIETPLEGLFPFIPKIDFVQFMGINHIGFQGELFDERVIEKIKAFRTTYGDMPISVDGGVNLENALPLLVAGATRLVSGSALFDALDIEAELKEFRNLLQ
ncbi:MAG: hypothetical protein AAB587_00520 [Patescibacteria group bacterium]